MRLLIVEDEPIIARRLLQFCRKILGDQIETISTAGSFDAASAQLAEKAFDVVLLDLNLSGQDGMSLLSTYVAGSFHTIVVSANVDQALRAFEYGVLDFVAKPFTEERLAQALDRVAHPVERTPYSARCLAVRKPNRIELVAVDDVLYVEGADKYSELVLRDGRRELHDKTLTHLEVVLPTVFERIHKSYIVRMSEVARMVALEGSHYEVELKNGQRLPVGRARYHEIKARLR